MSDQNDLDDLISNAIARVSTESLHDHILDLIFLALDFKNNEQPDKQTWKRLIFTNYKSNIDGLDEGLRLTSRGYSIMQDLFECYEVEYTPEFKSNYKKSGGMSPRNLLALKSKCNLPYFFNHEKICLFEQEIAVLLKLNDCQIYP